MPSFALLRAISYTNSVVFIGLLACWLAPGLQGATTVLGWCHGWLWIVLTVLCLIALGRRIIPFWLAVVVTIIGGFGPFIGSIGFWVETRRRALADGGGDASTSSPQAASPA